jgi:hypothetical protein
MRVSIWLNDGSIYQNSTVTGSNITVDGRAFDINTLDRMDNAFLYTLGGAKIYRNQVGGSLSVAVDGVAGGLTISVDQIDDLKRSSNS